MKIIITYNNKNNDILKKNCKKFITSSVNLSNFYNINFTKKKVKRKSIKIEIIIMEFIKFKPKIKYTKIEVKNKVYQIPDQ